MTANTQLYVAAAQLVTGTLRPELLPVLATAALEAGMDSPALIELAGERADHLPRAGAEVLLRRIFRELGATLPTPAAARGILLRHYAEAGIAGALSPAQAVVRIMDDVYFESSGSLGPERLYGESLGLHEIAGLYWEWHEVRQDIVEPAARRGAESELEAQMLVALHQYVRDYLPRASIEIP